MDSILEKLIEQYGMYSVDWMGFKLSKNNPLTYHHIKKNSEKGKKTIENGAPLTRAAHRFLNDLEILNPDLYEEWNKLFKDINNSEAPPTTLHKNKIRALRKKGEKLEKYCRMKK